MKKCILLILLIACLFYFCKENKRNNKGYIQTQSLKVENCDSLNKQQKGIKRIFNVNRIYDSLICFVNKKNKRLMIQSIITEDFTLYKFYLKDKSIEKKSNLDTISYQKTTSSEFYKSNSYGQHAKYSIFIIFVFNTIDKAKIYFQDLYTQEHLKSYGINKSPNYILRSDSFICWKNVSNAEEHKFSEIKSKFRDKIIKSFYNPFNSDSIVYGSHICEQRTTNYSNLLGKWKLVNYSSILESPVSHFIELSKKANAKLNNSVLRITKDSVILNRDVQLIEKLMFLSIQILNFISNTIIHIHLTIGIH